MGCAESGDEKPTGVVIREFRIEDYDALLGLWNEAGLSCRPKGRDRREKIEHELQEGKALFLVAECGGRMVGSIMATHDGRKGWLNRLAVAPSFRRRGLARDLTNRAECYLYEQGIEIIACLVEGWNTVSMQLCERLGYERHSDIIYFSKRKNPDV